MPAARLPDEEPARLEKLLRLDLIDSEPETEFDDVAALAATLMGCPIAAVSMIDESRQWFKARVGLEICETSREASFCAHTLLEREPLVAPDTTLDPRFADNPFVTGEAGLRFYCGIPIQVDGQAVGTLCVADTEPRSPTDAQIRALAALARQTSALIEARRAERRAREGEGLLRTAAEASFDVFGVLSPLRDAAGRIVDFRFDLANARAAGFFGLEPEGLIGRPLWESFPTDAVGAMVGRFREVMETGRPFETEYVSRMPSMEGRWVRLHAARSDGRLAVAGRDVHERRMAEAALRESEAKLATTFGALQVGILLVGRDGAVLQSNPAAERILEARMASIHGEGRRVDFELLRPEGEPMPPSERPIVRALGGESVRDADLLFRWPDGRERWVRNNADPVWIAGEATPYAAVCSFLDVTTEVRQRRRMDDLVRETAEANLLLEAQRYSLEKANAQLARLATTDGLTGLRNHRAFQERLEELLRAAAPLSCALLDVDRFKAFNDDHGHQTGDAVLRGVARALEEAAPAGSLVARYGGEEFAVVLPGAGPDAALRAAERLRGAIEARSWPHRPVTASVGVATLAPGMGREALIEAADRALYASKRAGRNRATHAASLEVGASRSA